MIRLQLSYDQGCFACGEKNPQGLKLKFTYEQEVVKTTFVPTEIHQGYPGVMHGGLVSTILDEIMSWALQFQGFVGYTARLEVRFRKNVPLEQPLHFESRIIGKRGSLIDTEAKALSPEGEVMAEAKGRFMVFGNLENK